MSIQNCDIFFHLAFINFNISKYFCDFFIIYKFDLTILLELMIFQIIIEFLHCLEDKIYSFSIYDNEMNTY